SPNPRLCDSVALWQQPFASAPSASSAMIVFGVTDSRRNRRHSVCVRITVMWYRSVSATHDEHTRRLPGDELIRDAFGQLTHAITIDRPPRDVWPWLVQMGAGSRGGWYSYDRLDNGGHPSANRVLLYLQQIEIGTLFPALPGKVDGFHVLAVDPGVSIVLGWRAPGGAPIVTWAFVLEDALNSTTRLVTRARASVKYPFFGLPHLNGAPVVGAVPFAMQRKQLLGIARRAEQFDPLLDQLIPDYDIVEHHSLRVEASPDVTLAAVAHVNLEDSRLVRAILKL